MHGGGRRRGGGEKGLHGRVKESDLEVVHGGGGELGVEVASGGEAGFEGAAQLEVARRSGNDGYLATARGA